MLLPGPGATEAHRVRRARLHGQLAPLLRPAVGDPLTPREFRLLAFLMAHPGRPWSREERRRRVWGALDAAVLDPRTVDVRLRCLRLKLEPDPARPVLIISVRGRGYGCG